jgi:SAM-dependent methyltransferase
MKICPACSSPVESSDWVCDRCGHRPRSEGNLLILAPHLLGSERAFPSESFARLAALEDRNYWFRARNRLIVWALRRHFLRLRSFLEVGCGTGCVLGAVEAAFPAAAALGSEAHVAGLECAARRLRRSGLVQMDAANIPFRDEFDVVGCFDVLEHIQDDSRVLEQCFLAARGGGGIILTVPQHPFLWSAADEYAGHVRRYTREEIVGKVVAAGFRPLLVTSFVSLLFPVLAATRRRHRQVDASYDPGAELQVGRVPNLMLERVLDFERQLIRLGVRFPFGGSLLVVARKPHVDPV